MVKCERCTYSFEVPSSLTAEQRREVGTCARKRGPLHAVQLLVSTAGVPLHVAKATVFHLASAGPTCHRCHTPVPTEPITHCTKCRSLVINW